MIVTNEFQAELAGYVRSAMMQGFAPMDDLTREAFAGAAPDALVCTLEPDDEEAVLVIYSDGVFSVVLGTCEYLRHPTTGIFSGCSLS